MMRYQWSGPGEGLWMIGGLLLLIGLIVVVVWVVNTLMRGDRGTHGPTSGPSGGPSGDPLRPTPNEILRERFARGEITQEQFEQARKVLGPDR